MKKLLIVCIITMAFACSQRGLQHRKDCSAFYIRLNGAVYSAFIVGCEDTLSDLSPLSRQSLGQSLWESLTPDSDPKALILKLNRIFGPKLNERVISAVYLRNSASEPQLIEGDGGTYVREVRARQASVVLFSYNADIDSLKVEELKLIADDIDRFVEQEGYSHLGRLDSVELRKELVGRLNKAIGRSVVEDIHLAEFSISEVL
jgi:hypothetical protein